MVTYDVNRNVSAAFCWSSSGDEVDWFGCCHKAGCSDVIDWFFQLKTPATYFRKAEDIGIATGMSVTSREVT